MHKYHIRDATNYPQVGDTARIHYIAKLSNGIIFDDSYKKNEPINIELGKGTIIRGWEEGVHKYNI